MTIEIRQLRYAVATADSQSFSRAAATMNVKQSTLSRRVGDLEIRLGVKLFERTTRGAQPTENGRNKNQGADPPRRTRLLNIECLKKRRGVAKG